METLTTTEAAHLLARECRSRCEPTDVARWVRHGQVPGEADGRGRVVVDGDGLAVMLAILKEKRAKRTTSPAVVEELAGLLRRER